MSPRGTKIDAIRTMAAKFDSRKSFIGIDGNEYLARGSADWNKRKWELYNRSKGECELKCSMYCHISFSFKKMHPHHIVRGRIGRHDGLDNLLAVCWECHRAAHPEKQVRWSKVST